MINNMLIFHNKKINFDLKQNDFHYILMLFNDINKINLTPDAYLYNLFIDYYSRKGIKLMHIKFPIK